MTQVCLNQLYDYSRGMIICEDTGEVLEENLVDTGPEWRAYNIDEYLEKSRVGASLIAPLGDGIISSTIDPLGYDATGKKLTLASRIKATQMSRIHKSNIGSKNKNLVILGATLKKISHKLSLPQHVSGLAALIYRKATEKTTLRGKSIAVLAAASVYMACKSSGIHRSIEEIAEAAGVDKKKLYRAYKFIYSRAPWKEIGMETPRLEHINILRRLASALSVDPATELEVIKILEKVKETGILSGKDPRGIVAGALYLTYIKMGRSVSPKKIAEALEITEYIVRTRAREIEHLLNTDRPNQTSEKREAKR